MGIGWKPLLLATGFGLHPTGMLHGNEAIARSGERWLAIESTASGLRLTPTRVRRDRVVDEMLDAPGEATGAEVVAVDVPAAAMLLRGPGLRAGPVESADVVVDEALAGDRTATFRFRGIDYRLQPRCPAELPAPGSTQACQMVLSGGPTRQALYALSRWRAEDGSIGYDDAAYRALMHVADFDRDGRPDLILDTADHYNTSQPTLFLSSPAPKGQALKQVALHHSTGC